MTIGKLNQLMTRTVVIRYLAVTFCGLMVMVGCKPAAESSTTTTGSGTAAANKDDHDHADHDHDHGAEQPKSYTEAYEMLVKQQSTIKEAFETDKPDYAHDPLHAVGGLLKAMKEFVAADAAMNDENKAAFAKAHDDLMVAFGELDSFFHDGEKVAYSEVAEQIDAAMATLKGFAK